MVCVESVQVEVFIVVLFIWLFAKFHQNICRE